MLFITSIAATSGVPTAVAKTIYNIAIGAGTAATVFTIFLTIGTAGATTFMLLGWTTIVQTVKSLAKKSIAAAIAWQ